jgi:Double zinc ribbon
LRSAGGLVEILRALREPATTGESVRRLRCRIPAAGEILSGLRSEGGLMNDIIVYPSKAKMGLLAVGSLALVVLCICEAVFRVEMEVPVWAAVVVAGIGAPLLAACFFWSLYRLLNPRPSVIVNREGITDNSTATSIGLIRWDEISQITLFTMGTTRHLGIDLHDREALLGRLPPAKASLLRAGFRITNVPISIPQTTLTVSADELAKQITAYWQALAANATPAPPRSRPVVESLARCPACGSSTQGAKFCPDCGESLRSKSECPQCGTKFPPGMKFCPECGVKVV